MKRKVNIEELKKLMEAGLTQSKIARRWNFLCGLKVSRGLIWIYFQKKKRWPSKIWERYGKQMKVKNKPGRP